MISGYHIWVVLLIGCGVFWASFVDAIGGGGGIISVVSCRCSYRPGNQGYRLS